MQDPAASTIMLGDGDVMSRIPSRVCCCLLALSLLTAGGCAVNPATGKRQLVLISEAQEIQLGLENDKAVVASMGLYDSDELQQYVEQLGRGLAAKSERPNLEWQFRVVDDSVVNAFALPGGFIYITRGILAHFNNEAELASVLGHEIGHVTARHGVNRLSKAQLAQLGLGVGMVLSEDFADYGGLAETGLGILFLKHSRDDERQADDLGLRYLDRGGYDPRPMPDVFLMLKRASEAAGGQSAPGWLSTHPDSENRARPILEQIAATERDFSGLHVHRETFLKQIDGIVFGEDPRQGFFEDNRFLHPEMKFRFDFPPGWQTQNQRSAVVGISAEQDALIRLTLASEATPGEALRKFLSQQGLRRGAGWKDHINGHRSASAYFSVDQQQGTLRGLVAFLAFDGRVFRLLGFSNSDDWESRGAAIREALSSFDRLTDRRALRVEPQRLKIVRLSQSMSLERFSERYSDSAPISTLALINQIDEGARLEAGSSYKALSGGRLP